MNPPCQRTKTFLLPCLFLLLSACGNGHPPTLEETLIGKWDTPTRTFEHFEHGGLEYSDSSGQRSGVWAVETTNVLMWGFKDGNDSWEKEYYQVTAWSANEFTFKLPSGGMEETAVRK